MGLETAGIDVGAVGIGKLEIVGDEASVKQRSTPVTGLSGSCLKPFTTSLSPAFLLEEISEHSDI